MENYALIARQEKQIEALKAENDYLKKVKNPTEIENANLRQRNDTLELENQSLQSEIQVMTEKHNLQVAELESDLEVTKQNAESAKSQNLKLTKQHKKEEQFKTLKMVCFSVVAVLLAFVPYHLGRNNASNDLGNDIQLEKVINYLVEHENSNKTVHPTMVSRHTGVDYDDVLLILLKLEKLGIVTKSQFPGGKQPLFQLK